MDPELFKSIRLNIPIAFSLKLGDNPYSYFKILMYRINPLYDAASHLKRDKFFLLF